MFLFLMTVSWGPPSEAGCGRNLTDHKVQMTKSLRLQTLHRTVHDWVFSLPCSRDTNYRLRPDPHLLLFLKSGLWSWGS